MGGRVKPGHDNYLVLERTKRCRGTMAHLTDEEVVTLERAFERKKPAMPDPATATELEMVESFAEVPTNRALHVRLRMKDGSEHNLVLNPVVARLLALSVLYRGEEGGWLDQYGDVISSS
jgi:hypothetical protein